jgi:hypothetical protein
MRGGPALREAGLRARTASLDITATGPRSTRLSGRGHERMPHTGARTLEIGSLSGAETEFQVHANLIEPLAVELGQQGHESSEQWREDRDASAKACARGYLKAEQVGERLAL